MSEPPVNVVLRADGRVEHLPAPPTLAQVRELIDAHALDGFRLPDGVRYVFVDDAGHARGRPLNKAATALYWERCGGPVDHWIVGDALIVRDADMGGDA